MRPTRHGEGRLNQHRLQPPKPWGKPRGPQQGQDTPTVTPAHQGGSGAQGRDELSVNTTDGFAKTKCKEKVTHACGPQDTLTDVTGKETRSLSCRTYMSRRDCSVRPSPQQNPACTRTSHVGQAGEGAPFSWCPWGPAVGTQALQYDPDRKVIEMPKRQQEDMLVKVRPTAGVESVCH